MPPASPAARQDFVTRPEFETFEKNVENNFERVDDNFNLIRSSIADLSHETKSAIVGLGDKIDGSRKVDYKGISLVITIILAIGALVGFIFTDEVSDLEKAQSMRSESLSEKVEAAHKYVDKTVEHLMDEQECAEGRLRELEKETAYLRALNERLAIQLREDGKL